MSEIKVAVLGTRGFPNVQGGVEAHCEKLYPRLARLGCAVTVFGRAPYLENRDSPQKIGIVPIFFEGVRIVPLDCPKSKSLEAIVHTFKGILAARKFRPDILHIHAIGPSIMAPLARILGMRVVMTNHGPDYRRQKWGALAKFILWSGEVKGSLFANAIIAISRVIGDDIRRKYGRTVSVIPNGVVIPEIAKSDAALKKYGLEREKYILAVGRFVPEKGLHDLIDAFGKIWALPKERGQSLFSADGWKLVIVGRADHEDDYSRRLKEMAARNKNIVLTGFQSGTPLTELYSHAGLFVLPSYYEGLPIVLLEALSYGLSCIVSDIPANREVALAEERYFKAGDVAALAAKLTEFMAKPMTGAEREAQVACIAKNYNWDDIAKKTLAVYCRVV